MHEPLCAETDVSCRYGSLWRADDFDGISAVRFHDRSTEFYLFQDVRQRPRGASVRLHALCKERFHAIAVGIIAKGRQAPDHPGPMPPGEPLEQRVIMLDDPV